MTTRTGDTTTGAGRICKALLGLAVALMMLMGSTAYAVPATPQDGGGGQVSVCGTTTTSRATRYLPVERWSEATTGFHYRLDADAWHDLAEKVQRNGRDSAFMQVGNAVWRLGADAMYASSTFCPIQTLGYPLDSLAGTIGQALGSSGLITLLVATTVAVALVRMRKGGGGAYVLKETLKTGAVLGVMTSMILGAGASTEQGPGTGSPWWWVMQANTVVNSVSGTLAAATVDSSQGLMGYQPLSSEEGDANDWPVTCTTTGDATGYLDYLHDQYSASYTQDGSADARAAALPEMVSTMWEAGVLPVWAAAQFGADNPYTDHVYCFYLDARSHATVASNKDLKAYMGERLGMSEQTQNDWDSKTRSQITNGGNAEDQSLLGWAACIPTGGQDAKPRGDWASKINNSIKPEDCRAWWYGGDDLHESTLDWDEKSVEDNAEGSADVYNYAASLHGKDGTQVGGIMFAYLIGSLASGAILLLLALLQLASKLIVAFMVIGLFAALARSLTPGDDWRLFRRTGLQLLGACFVSSCAGLMIAIILMVAGVIAKVGAQTFSPGTTGAVLATCLGPAAGVFLLHWVFTSVLHVPSPFSVKGAMAWGQGITSGAVGGAVGASVMGLGSNVRETAKRATGRPGTRPRPGDGRPKPDEIDPSKATRGGDKHRSVFTGRSATERLRQGEERKRLLDEARAERAERKSKVEAEAKRLAKADGRLGEDDAWRDYRAKARSSLRRAHVNDLKERVRSAPGTVWNQVGQAASGLGARTVAGVRQSAARATQGLDAAHALAGWAAHHMAKIGRALD